MVISGHCHFLPFYPPKPPKIRIWKNEKKKRNARDIIILHLCTKNHNHMRFGSWDTDWEGQNFLSFCAIFCLFTHQTTQKVKILKKWKKHQEMSLCSKNHNHMMYASWDMECGRDSFLSFWAILDTCIPQMTIIWSTVPEISRATEFFVISDLFLPYYPPAPLATWKIKILEKWKKDLEISLFYNCVLQMAIIWCMVPEIWNVMGRIFCHFRPFIALLSP